MCEVFIHIQNVKSMSIRRRYFNIEIFLRFSTLYRRQNFDAIDDESKMPAGYADRRSKCVHVHTNC